MEVRFTPYTNSGLVAVQGHIDALTAGELITFTTGQINQGHHQMVLDLSQVEFMSSAGLRAILVTLKESRGKGGDLRLAAPQAAVEKVLKISGFTSFLKCYPTVEQALASFSE